MKYLMRVLVFVMLTTGLTLPVLGQEQPNTGQIVFWTRRDRNYEIYLMNADGSDPINLTNDPAFDREPSWSPDGMQIAFSSARDGNAEIYVMNADGSNVIRLTDNPTTDEVPVWSPDGTQLAFQSNRDGNFEIYLMNADGSDPINLTNNPANDELPAWSPDGTQIAFTSHRDRNAEIYVMNADGSDPINLTHNPANDIYADWSPDGTAIAFASNRTASNLDIYVMGANGSNPTNLTSSPERDGSPAWSLDGTQIAFVSYRDGNDEIYVMRADGGNIIRLTDHPAEDEWPRWRPLDEPEGELDVIALSDDTNIPAHHPFAGETAWIAYQTNRGGSEGVWLIHPDGTDDHQIAEDFAGDLKYANWSPDGTRLVMTSRNTGGTEPLFEYNLETGTLRQLFSCADPCVGDDEPVYSPDGEKVAFVRALAPFVNDVPSDCGIWLGDIETGEVTQITSNTDPPCSREYFPRWSPDGTQLTYTHTFYENGQTSATAVYVVNADGSSEQRLTDPEMFAGDPDWSPDGDWIVFSTYPLFEFNHVPAISNLYRMHPDGSGMEQLTHYETEDLRATQPLYTPNGEWIIFTAVTPSSRSLWAIPADGGESVVIAQGGIYIHGTWQPQPNGM